jgi:hypothetical protein
MQMPFWRKGENVLCPYLYLSHCEDLGAHKPTGHRESQETPRRTHCTVQEPNEWLPGDADCAYAEEAIEHYLPVHCIFDNHQSPDSLNLTPNGAALNALILLACDGNTCGTIPASGGAYSSTCRIVPWKSLWIQLERASADG